MNSRGAVVWPKGDLRTDRSDHLIKTLDIFLTLIHRDLEVCITEIHRGEPLCLLKGECNGFWDFHLEGLCLNPRLFSTCGLDLRPGTAYCRRQENTEP